MSDWQKVSKVVSQGSVLGSVLFNISNDLDARTDHILLKSEDNT